MKTVPENTLQNATIIAERRIRLAQKEQADVLRTCVAAAFAKAMQFLRKDRSKQKTSQLSGW